MTQSHYAPHRPRFCARSARAKHLHSWMADFGSPLEERLMRSARVKLAMKRKKLGGQRSSRNYRY